MSPTFDSVALHRALVLLASDRERTEKRQLAARELLGYLRQLVRGHRTRRLLSSPAAQARGVDLVEDAIQHVAIAACTGNARFRGAEPAAAVAWCVRILGNYLRSEFRRQALLRREALAESPELSPKTMPQYEGVLWHRPAQDAHLMLYSLDGQVRAHLRRTRSRRAAESLYRAVQGYLASLAGATSIASTNLGLPETREPHAAHRARNRAYQHEHRARSILAELKEAEEKERAHHEPVSC